ncbi:MAG: ROK family protein [Actinomycetaceae bacterium]|nr:ROK family protein [Actinomycetaceae bacterium]
MNAPKPLHAIGIDTGGTSIKAAIVRTDGQVLTHLNAPTPTDESQYVQAVADLVEKLRLYAQQNHLELVETVGLDTPGLVNDEAGIVEYSANLGWRNFPVRDQVAARLGCPVAYGHDVRNGALAESYWGAAHPNFFYIAIGTGIATVLVINHQPLATGGWIGEMGQLVTNPGTDNPLTLEQIAAAGGIRRAGRAAGLIDAGDGAAEVYRLSDSGHRTAQNIVAEATAALATALAPVIAAVGPIPIVIGGGLANRGQQLFDELALALTPLLGEIPLPPIEGARLGSWSQVQGAACRAFQQNNPSVNIDRPHTGKDTP